MVWTGAIVGIAQVITSLTEGVLSPQVHDSVRGDELASARHRTFILSHYAGAALAASALPLHWIVNGALDTLVVATLCWLMTPALVAIYLSRTGALAMAHLLTSSILLTVICIVATRTGGLSSFAVFWLLAIPVEAALSGSRKVVIAALCLCLLALLGLFAAGETGFLPASRLSSADAAYYNALGLLSALIYVGMLAGTIEHLSGKSRRAVEHSTERYRLLAENATDMITRHQSDGAVLYVSAAASRLVACEPALLAADGFARLVHPHDRHVYAAAFAKASDTGQPATAEFRLARDFADDEFTAKFTWVELNCRPISVAAGQPGACEIVAVTRDISLRKRQQEELRIARDAAEDSNRAKTTFLANMSHELRTPLNSVIGFAELLEREVPGNERASTHQEYATLIKQGGEHLLGVVNDLLDLSKIEAGQMSLCLENIDLNDVAVFCEQAMKATADDAGVKVELSLAQGGAPVLGDERACKQIILNLLSNAVKFSEPGSSVQVQVSVTGQHGCVVVRDHGSGIPAEVLGRLGQPFVQADGAYSRSHEGAGLGLSIVKGLVKLHNGTISIDSVEHRGTSITVSLPANAAASDADAAWTDAREAAVNQVEPMA